MLKLNLESIQNQITEMWDAIGYIEDDEVKTIATKQALEVEQKLWDKYNFQQLLSNWSSEMHDTLTKISEHQMESGGAYRDAYIELKELAAIMLGKLK